MHYKEGDRRLAKKFFESCLLLSPDTPDKAYIQGYLKRCYQQRRRVMKKLLLLFISMCLIFGLRLFGK